MLEPLRLTEYEPWSGPLTTEDADFIAHGLAGKVSIRRDVSGTHYILNPNQFVGLVTLPSARLLESRPKVSVKALFFMLAQAFDLPSPFRTEPASLERLDQILDFLAGFFADTVDELINAGLYRAYVEEEENLNVLRGRIVFTEDLRRNFALRQRVFCRYADLTWDVPENQVLAQVAHMLAGWNFGRHTRQRLTQIDRMLSALTRTTFLADDVRRFSYHRLNDRYRPLHQLCTLFLEGASLSESVGAFEARSFLIDMNRLFEKFVGQILRDRLPRAVRIAEQEPTHLGVGRRVLMRPDILLSTAGRVRLVGDCKYKRLETEEFKNHDLYQVLAYCTSLGVQRGLLVYPRHSVAIEYDLPVLGSKVVIRQATIDLGKSWQDLMVESDRFATMALEWMEPMSVGPELSLSA
jgi:5-methylcytosine-specific restriction enzyme subunit McrC